MGQDDSELLDIGGIISDISDEIQRIFPSNGFDGTVEQYEWLDKHYSVTVEDDFRYIIVCDYYIEDPDELDEEQLESIENEMQFLDDPEAVNVFLLKLLEKYRSSHAVYEPGIREPGE